MANPSAPVNPISATTNEHLTGNTNPTRARSSFFRNRSSNASLLSLSSLKSMLPQYSVTDTLEESPASPVSEIATDISSSPPSSWNSPSTIEPPRYSLLPSRQSMVLNRRASTVTPFEADHDGSQGPEFRYAYPIRAKNPWATLHLQTGVTAPGTHSGSVQNQPRIPRFWSCDPIKGTVQLDLDTAQIIHQISITLNGNVVLSSHIRGLLPFLNREHMVWVKSMGALQSDRLIPGQHMFPFSFPFPAQTDITDLDENSNSPFPPQTAGTKIAKKPHRRWTGGFTSASDESPSSSRKSQASGHTRSESSRNLASQMPPTFMEKGIDPNVAYDLSVRIVHGRFKTSSKIRTNITYLPASEPLPASQKRREAYEEGALMPCPMDDPDGWFSLPTVKTYGVVEVDANLRHTRVDCTVYIAQPLSYTRGSVIPCFITIHSEGVEMADVLPSTERPTVRLLRRVWHPMTTTPGPLGPSFGSQDVPGYIDWGYAFTPTVDMSLVTHEVGRANWWIPSKEVIQDLNSRHLEGEIHLSPDLQPSCGFQSFRIEYAVELLSFEADNFTPEVHPSLSGSDDVTVSNPVEITTLHREGEPVPTAYSEPPRAYQSKRVLPGKGDD